MDGIISYVKIY